MTMLFEIFKISLICYVFWYLQKPYMVFHFYRTIIDRLPWYLSYPLGKCYTCLTGQVLLWYYVIEVRPFKVIDMLFFPAAGIFLSYCYDKLMEWLLE